jgi:GDP-L-fucose synthase
MFWSWAREARPGKTICFSSSAAYPVRLQREPDYVLLSEEMLDLNGEDDIGRPDMSYGWAKLTSEYLARLAHREHGLDTVCYRPFSGYGEDQDIAYPVPSICRRAIAGAATGKITVWGSGRQLRDFIHIDDCVRGVVSTMGSIDDGSALNLSTGILTSLGDLARLAAEIVGYDAVVEPIEGEPEGVFARGGDTAKQRRLGFEPSITLRDGIARSIAHLVGAAAGAS